MILLEVDPNLVRPGWGALVVTSFLALAIVLLFISMRRQFRKINIEPTEPEEPEESEESEESEEFEAAKDSEANSTEPTPGSQS